MSGSISDALTAAENVILNAVDSDDGIAVIERIENVAISAATTALEVATPGILHGVEELIMGKLRDAVLRETAKALMGMRARRAASAANAATK